ncbi:hypothetical protein [Sphingomonas sp. M1-B02]|uniref:hypothetical protein n=1 Tax=Sphingomonas sp. M1-B02 TaxID=3114300 RepID=UPI0022408AB4|nr:hypothetical protein [Sphingomonas sp. S6-11]UZK65854.1 hypothetical protein OKW87_15280 [Sphingomonas sp. S6-11]
MAVGLLSARDLERLGSGFSRCFPVADDGQFEDLLKAIDAADTQSCIRDARDDIPPPAIPATG